MIPLKATTKTSNDHSEDLRVLINLSPDVVAACSFLLKLDRSVAASLVKQLDDAEITELYHRLVAGWNKNTIM